MGYKNNPTNMRHLYTLMIAILPALAYGQDAAQKGHFEYGVFGGRQLRGKIYDSEKMGAVSGWTGGIDLGYRDKAGISFHFQPNFSTFESVSEEGKDTQVYHRLEWTWHAVNVPLTARYTLPTGKVRPFIEAGINLRLRTKLSLAYRYRGCGIAGCSGSEGVDDVRKNVTNDPLGAVASIGVEFDVLSVTIPVSLRLNEGFGTYDLRPDQKPGSGYGDLKTRVVQVTAGVRFGQ